MTDSIVEKVAKLARPFTWCFAKHNESLEFAQAAIEALGVIVLPWDAAVQEGDHVKQFGAYEYDYVFKVFKIDGRTAFEFNKKRDYRYTSSIEKIIQRDGKHVIMEEK